MPSWANRTRHFALSGALFLALTATVSCASIDWYIDPYDGLDPHGAQYDSKTVQEILQDLHGREIEQGTGVPVGYGHRLSLEVAVWYSSNHELVYSGPIDLTYKNTSGGYRSSTKEFDASSVFPFGLYGMKVGGSREFSIHYTCSPDHVFRQASCLLFHAEMAGRVVEVRNDDGLDVKVSFKSSCTPVEFSWLHILSNPVYRKDLGCFLDSLEGPKPMSSWFDQDENTKHGSLIRPIVELGLLKIGRLFDVE